MKPLLINFAGGPGAGKSTLAASVFAALKMEQYNVELVTEHAKDMTWSERQNELGNQVYVLGKQYHKLWRLVGKVDAIITDSPLLLSIIYNDGKLKHLEDLVWELYEQFDNENFFVKRTRSKYVQEGRNQTLEKAKEIDAKIAGQLYSVTYVEPTKDAVENIVEVIKAMIDRRKYER